MKESVVMIGEKLSERKDLLKRAFPRVTLYEIGRKLGIRYFDQFYSGWEIDEDAAALEISSQIDDEKLKEIFTDFQPRDWIVFRGKYYSLEEGRMRLEGSWETIQTGIRQVRNKYRRGCSVLLGMMIKSGGVTSLGEVRRNLRLKDAYPILEDLESAKVIVASYRSEGYREWKILEETLPIIQSELRLRPKSTLTIEKSSVSARPSSGKEKIDYVLEEKRRIKKMDSELTAYLDDLLKHRLNRTIRFGREFSLSLLAKYLQDLFGSVLYFDSLLSITQQYGLANVEIVHEHGRTGRRTGWSLALFGEPGTGKSFSTRDMILGRPRAKIPPHGVPGRNRYCGGITPARFIRIGQAYVGRTFNFIVPEFNDFFKYKGMVEPLKLAMEQGEIKYETHREVIGPYRFDSFFSVNYNVSVQSRGYAVTVQDPNFNAIEDRMLCRLHRLTKERFVEIAQSQMRLAFGEIDIEKGAQTIRDHVALIYAIETRHPLVKDKFPFKPIMITPHVYEVIKKAREAILEEIPEDVVPFSARLEDRALRFACAASIMGYFNTDLNHIPVSEDALRYVVQLYIEEASVRSQEKFEPEDILKRIYKSFQN